MSIEPVYVTEIRIGGRRDAEIVMGELMEGEVSYGGVQIEECGFSYRFRTEKGLHTICENGKVHAFVTECSGSLAGSVLKAIEWVIDLVTVS